MSDGFKGKELDHEEFKEKKEYTEGQSNEKKKELKQAG